MRGGVVVVGRRGEEEAELGLDHAFPNEGVRVGPVPKGQRGLAAGEGSTVLQDGGEGEEVGEIEGAHIDVDTHGTGHNGGDTPICKREEEREGDEREKGNE